MGVIFSFLEKKREGPAMESLMNLYVVNSCLRKVDTELILPLSSEEFEVFFEHFAPLSLQEDLLSRWREKYPFHSPGNIAKDDANSRKATRGYEPIWFANSITSCASESFPVEEYTPPDENAAVLLIPYLRMTIKQAAEELGVSVYMLRKQWSEATGGLRWPSRALRRLNAELAQIECLPYTEKREEKKVCLHNEIEAIFLPVYLYKNTEWRRKRYPGRMFTQ